MYEKDVWIWCPHCNKEIRITLEINDSFANAKIQKVSPVSKQKVTD